MTRPSRPQSSPGPKSSFEARHLSLEFIHAASVGHLPRMEQLLAQGARVDDPDPRPPRSTPLIYAIENRDARIALQTVEWLLARGANPNLPRANGFTPLMSAATVGSATLIATLAAAGASLDPHDQAGRNALQHAARSASEKAFLELLRLGANPMALDRQLRSGVTIPLLSDACRSALTSAAESHELNAALPASPRRPAPRV